MQVDFDRNDVARWLSSLTRASCEQSPEAFIFKMARPEISLPPLGFAELDELIERLGHLSQGGETTLISPQYYEVLVREEAAFPFRSRILQRNPEATACVDPERGITYELSLISDEYLVFLLHELSEQALIGGYHGYPTTLLARWIEEQDEPSIFGAARYSLRSYSLKITSSEPLKANRFRSLANSYCFQISYNADAALVPIRLLDDVSRGARISRVRRADPDDVDPPRRIYEEDPVHYYLQGVSADSPLMQYLSFYHVAEHLFERIFQDALVDRVRRKITQPRFSYGRNQDITELVKLISDSLRVRNEEITFSEQEALKLTLQKYVDISELCLEISAYDESLLEFYRTQPVSFSEGGSVDLRNSDIVKIYQDLASRIYRTRNALVHSKEGEKRRFVPFRDDRALIREVPLMRFIAEAIIVGSSSLA